LFKLPGTLWKNGYAPANARQFEQIGRRESRRRPYLEGLGAGRGGGRQLGTGLRELGAGGRRQGALGAGATARAALAAAIDDPAGRAPYIEALFRVGHDLKGQGSSFGYPLVTKIGHSLCALTRDRARQYESKHLELAKSHLDAIDLILTKGIKGEGGKVGTELVAKLEQRVSELLG
jgi:hypothetical protein